MRWRGATAKTRQSFPSDHGRDERKGTRKVETKGMSHARGKSLRRHFRAPLPSARRAMTAGAVAAAVVSAPAQSIGTRRRGSRGGATRHARASLSDPGFAADDARWDAAWTSVRDASTRVAFIDGDARRDLRARLTRTNLREALAAIPGEVHLRAEVRTGASEALGDVRAMDLHGGLFGHVDAGATDDGVRRGIETLERDIADVVRSFGKTCGEDSAVVQVSLLRKTLCSKYHVDWVPLRAMVTYFGDGTEVLSAAASDAITRARALGPFAEDLAKSLAATAVSADATSSSFSGECDVVLMKGERWPGNAGRAIVHRSPDVDGDAGEWRLCLRVDAPRWVNPATNE